METITTNLGGDEDTLVRRYDGYVRALAGRLHRRIGPAAELDDMVAWGRVGLLQAVRRYRTDRGCTLKSFAHRRIEGAMLDGLRRYRRQERLEVTVHGLDRNWRARREISGEVSETEMAATVDTALTAHILSMSAGGFVEPADLGADPEAMLTRREEYALLHACVDRLPARDARLIRGYFFEEKSLSELGREFQLSKARMSRLVHAACQRLGDEARRAGIDRPA